jgi:uncharacterized protein (DUF488 family)
MQPRSVYTIGHSTHPLETFLELLRENRIRLLADIRAFPSSRRYPQFNREALAKTLVEPAIAYRWLPELGGRRHSRPDSSPHTAWRVAAFRSYADYAATPPFAAAIAELTAIAEVQPSAVMCAEGLWWRCHRRIVADYLTVAGWHVRHILPGGKLADHELPPFARLHHGQLIYDGGQQPLLELE